MDDADIVILTGNYRYRHRKKMVGAKIRAKVPNDPTKTFRRVVLNILYCVWKYTEQQISNINRLERQHYFINIKAKSILLHRLPVNIPISEAYRIFRNQI